MHAQLSAANYPLQIGPINERAQSLFGYDVAGAMGGAKADPYTLDRALAGQYW